MVRLSVSSRGLVGLALVVGVGAVLGGCTTVAGPPVPSSTNVAAPVSRAVPPKRVASAPAPRTVARTSQLVVLGAGY